MLEAFDCLGLDRGAVQWLAALCHNICTVSKLRTLLSLLEIMVLRQPDLTALQPRNRGGAANLTTPDPAKVLSLLAVVLLDWAAKKASLQGLLAAADVACWLQRSKGSRSSSNPVTISKADGCQVLWFI